MDEKMGKLCENCGYPLSSCICEEKKDKRRRADSMFGASKISNVSDLLTTELEREVEELTLDRKVDQIKVNVKSFKELLLSQEGLTKDERNKIEEKCEEAEWAGSDMLAEANSANRVKYRDLCLQHMREAWKIVFKMEASDAR